MLDDQHVLITGAGRGIGRATAHLLAQLGARISVVDLDESAHDVADELGDSGHAYVCDLTAKDAPSAAVAAAVAAHGDVDILINNAGATADAPVHTMSDAQFDAMLDLHARVPFRVIRAVAPHMRDPAKRDLAAGVERFRKIVNISSISGTMGNATQVNYAAGKAAVVGMTKSLAKEWGPWRINVNAVAFGFMQTRLTEALPEATQQLVEHFTPLRRAGSVEEAAGPVAFLCSPWSDYVTGQVLTVSGGIPFGMSS